MKNFNFTKTVVLLFAVLAFSNCTDSSDPIQFKIIDGYENSVPIKGLQGMSTYTVTSSADLSSALDGAAKFVEAKVTKVTISLVDYSGASINGTLDFKVQGTTFFNQIVNLTANPTEITIPANAGNILNFIINNNNLSYTLTGTTVSPIEDNDFSLKVVVTIDATVQQP